MSDRYPGGIITKSPATPTGPIETGAAPGVWTLEQQIQFNQQGIWPTAGVLANYIEDVFSTYLYTGNSTSQTITNNIDLSTKGGLVWFKNRTAGSTGQMWYDTSRGAYKAIQSDSTGAEANYSPDGLSAFTTSGFSVNGASDYWNLSANNYCSWTFREQPKFFDIVTYTGTGSNTTIAHNLGSAPGCMIVKCTSNAVGWNVYHRSLTSAAYQLELNTTSAEFSDPTIWNSTAPTSSVFSVGTNLGINGSGRTYVAYLFAHNAGGFGPTGTDNVISCGTFTTDGSGLATVSLGYEPQWTMIKRTDSTDNWRINDVMRGSTTEGGQNKTLNPNSSSVETSGTSGTHPTATGFTVQGVAASATFIYIAIRRGPMKVPTLGTSVFNTIVRAGTGTATAVTGAGFPPDFMISHSTNVGSNNVAANDKLRGPLQFIATNNTNAEATVANALVSLDQDGFSVGTLAGGPYNIIGQTNAAWMFRRAPSFFDEVCYTGTGSATTQTHNLGVVPEMMIVKRRDTAGYNWNVYLSTLGASSALWLNDTTGELTGVVYWNSTSPTSSVFSIGSNVQVNASGGTYVAYLFATCAGVSKVGSYTGTGTTLQINCGFTAGTRFVLIKRTDSTGDWYVWDSTRGIVAGNDPYLLLNDAAAEVTGTDYIDTYSAGFEISSTAPAAINASAGTFIFLAIA